MGINVALDGPSGAGKSTIARAAAERLKYLYVDTGAMYRAVAYYVLSNNLDPNDREAVINSLNSINIELKYTEQGQRIILNGDDVSSKIRTPEVSMAASVVSAIGETREFLLSLQKKMAYDNDVIMDGRDIATVVLPGADVKIFLTASAEKRAKRRYDELVQKGENVTYEEVLADVNQRDYNDTHRDVAPLKQADDAILVDTSDLTLEESIEKIVSAITEKISSKNRTHREIPAIRPVAKGNKPPIWKRICHVFLRAIAKAIFYLYLDLSFEGLENVPKDGSNIFASNHRSYTDPILISLKPKVMFSFMAKEELFKKNKIFAIIIRLFGAFPVARGSGGAEAIETSLSRLNKGYNLVIFPEGTRSKDGKVLKGKTGVALVAAMAQVPVIPTGIVFEGKIKFRRKVTVKFAPPIIPSEIGVDDCSTKKLKILKNEIMSSITELVEGNTNEVTRENVNKL